MRYKYSSIFLLSKAVLKMAKIRIRNNEEVNKSAF